MIKSLKLDISVILVNFNTVQLTVKAIKSVIEKTNKLSYEIIVVDNASEDNSEKILLTKFPHIKFIKNKKNIGFGRANNIGIKKANGTYCFLLNTDTYLINNAIEILFQFMEKKENTKVAVVGGMLYNKDLQPNVYAGNFPSFSNYINNTFFNFFFSKPSKTFKTIPYLPEGNLEVDYVSGANFFIRKKILDKVGGFNKKFFLYFEETELCYRIKQKIKGAKCMIISEAKIVHLSQGSSNNKSKDKWFRKQFIKSKFIYFTITQGVLKGLIYRLVSLKRYYFNENI